MTTRGIAERRSRLRISDGTATESRTLWRGIMGISVSAIAFCATPGSSPAVQPPDVSDPIAAPSPSHNHLAGETSAHLRRHADTPVDWWPWGDEAFARARAEDKPVFLSSGYLACHWCHVMERECFRDPAIAARLNRDFVCIKLDREERPDVDQTYLTALRTFGTGGWPMSIFLTPEGKPFYGGTYFPPEDRPGLTGFSTVLDRVARAWREDRDRIERVAGELDAMVGRILVRRAASSVLGPPPVLSSDLTDACYLILCGEFDPEYGGFGFDRTNPRRPKFPEPSRLLFLLERHAALKERPRPVKTPARSLLMLDPGPAAAPLIRRAPLDMALFTLDRIARGGLRDHVGGGYHRYCVSRFWIVPHFEKTLYDNAQLARVFVRAFELTGDPRWRDEAEAIFDFVAREMTLPEGGFLSALDAESRDEDGGEYYLWTRPQVEQALANPEESRIVLQVYGMLRDPNFEGGRYVLLEPRERSEHARALGLELPELTRRLDAARRRLHQVRDQRPAPRKDDKAIAGWNGLMIAALAEAGRVCDHNRDRYLKAAQRAAEFAWTQFRREQDRLARTWRQGVAKGEGFAEDYAFLAEGLLRLYRADGDPRWLERARRLTERMRHDFGDPDPNRGGLFFASRRDARLPARFKDPLDSVLPSANAVAARVLIELGRLDDDPQRYDQAEAILREFLPDLARRPGVWPMMMVALEELLQVRPELSKAHLSAPSVDNPLDGKLTSRNTLPVQARLEALEEAVQFLRRGREAEVKLILTIRPGWSVLSANPFPLTLRRNAASASGLVTLPNREGEDAIPQPLAIELDPDAAQHFELVDVRFPPGRLKPLETPRTEAAVSNANRPASPGRTIEVYEARVEVIARLRPHAQRSNFARLGFRIRYQACEDRVWSAPAELSVEKDLGPR